MNQQNKPTVIVGGGFTGMFTDLHLKHRNYSPPVLLIDQKDRFTFQPLLYEYFSNEMNTDQVCPRYVDLLEGNGITLAIVPPNRGIFCRPWPGLPISRERPLPTIWTLWSMVGNWLLPM